MLYKLIVRGLALLLVVGLLASCAPMVSPLPSTAEGADTDFADVDQNTGFISDCVVDAEGDLYILYTLGYYDANRQFRTETYVVRCSGGAATNSPAPACRYPTQNTAQMRKIG